MELDVIVFEAGDRRFAMELRFVQEVFALGHVTPVPLAPPAIQGAANLRGKMVPVVSVGPLFGLPSPPKVLPGTAAILATVDDTTAAIPVRRVVDVVSVPRSRYEEGGQGSGPLVPGSFRGAAGTIPLLDIEAALRTVRASSRQANELIHSRSETR
ncbi:MAG: chemotaxis protein CheW [bacterium]